MKNFRYLQNKNTSSVTLFIYFVPNSGASTTVANVVNSRQTTVDLPFIASSFVYSAVSVTHGSVRGNCMRLVTKCTKWPRYIVD